MCGFTGIFAFNDLGYFYAINVNKALKALEHRGPDSFGFYSRDYVSMGHRRLSVIDTSSAARQPMQDPTGRWVIVFNGEIFNFLQLKKELTNLYGCSFQTNSDTEVLLQGLIHEGEAFLQKLVGFFSFALYDAQEATMLLVRDRFGVKPLLYFADEDKLIFGSELPSIVAYGVKGDWSAPNLINYLKYNYQPEPNTIFQNIHKLKAGHLLRVKKKSVELIEWYLPKSISSSSVTYESAIQKIRELTEEAVNARLVSDVPIGSFLSGGIDSSIVTGLAAKATDRLHTFSLGFRDYPYFDETKYAYLVSKHFNTEHTVFSIGENEMLDHVVPMLEALDEPFADSSALAVYILAKKVRPFVTVALSGDGADEYFGGYIKHRAFYRSFNPGLAERLLQWTWPLLNVLPQHRANPLANKIRRWVRFGKGMGMTPENRYHFWASISSHAEAEGLVQPGLLQISSADSSLSGALEIGNNPTNIKELNDVLRSDVQMVLPGDMLFKVDRMSMANGLEVRSPFLDHRLIEYVQSLPSTWKADAYRGKKILKDAFKDFLPSELYLRSKKGFEVPLLDWLRKPLRPLWEYDLLSEKMIREQGIFDNEKVTQLKKQLLSSNPQDSHARMWALIVYQYWWRKNVLPKSDS